jgi:uncharacterized cupredoxin-like copper-binding protein
MTKNRYLWTAGAASLIFLGACGSDDDSGAGDAAACDAWVTADAAVIGYLFTGQGDADAVTAALDAAIDAADPDIEQTIVDLKAASAEQIADPESSDASDETLALYADTIEWAGENCDVETLDVTAVDYGFEGLPDQLSTGYTVVTFTNEGQEQHEIFALRFNDDTTETLEEIAELPEEEAIDKITPVNATWALPGTSDTVSWNLTEAGRYAIVCFIPVGSVGESEGDGPPHFAEGMVQEFTVS